jgi:hypothetical protein
MIFAVVLIMVLAGSLVYSIQMGKAHRQAARTHQAEAVLLEASGSRPVPRAAKGGGGPTANQGSLAKIRWIGQDGVQHVQQATVPMNRAAGTHITVWVDSSGALTGPPPGHDEAVFAAVLAVGASAWAMLFGYYGVRAARRVRFTRRAAANIDRGWERVASAWVGRRS